MSGAEFMARWDVWLVQGLLYLFLLAYLSVYITEYGMRLMVWWRTTFLKSRPVVTRVEPCYQTGRVKRVVETEMGS